MFLQSKLARIFGFIWILASLNVAIAEEPIILSGSDSAMDHYIFSNILKSAYASLGIESTFTPLPSSRSLVSANSGDTHGEIARIEGMNKKYVNLIQVPIAIMTSGIYALSLHKHSIAGWKDLSKQKVAYRRGIQIIKNELDKHHIQTNVVNKDRELMLFLLRKRTDIILQDKGLAISSMTQLKAEGIGIKNIHFLAPPLIEVNLYHYLNNQHRHLLAGITKALDKIKTNGELDKKIKDYFDQLMQNLNTSN